MSIEQNSIDLLVKKLARRDQVKQAFKRLKGLDRKRTTGEDEEFDSYVLELQKLDAELEELKALVGLAGVDVTFWNVQGHLSKLKRSTRIETKLEDLRPTLVEKPAPPTNDDFRERVFHDFVFFCAQCLQINYRPGMLASHPAGGYGPFILTYAQQRIVAVLVRMLLIERVPTRVIILKSRQLGCTTLMLAFWTWMMVTHDHYHVLFMIDKDAHGRTKRDELLNWFQRLSKYEFFPSVAVRDQKFIKLSNGSIFLFESAESPNPGTSEMLHGLHESEKPKWPNGRAAQVEASVVPSLPAAPLTLHIDESTAMGADDFQTKWDLANQPKGDVVDTSMVWVPIFLPWYISPEYATEVPGDFKYENDDEDLQDQCQLTDGGEMLLTEEQYAERYKLTPQQVYWRRTKIKVAFKGNRAVFDQEYPTTAAHAWRATQQSFFPRRMLERAQATLRVPTLCSIVDARGYADVNNVMSYHELHPRVQVNNSGALSIWQSPVPGRRYYIGVDASEGKSTTTAQGELVVDWTRLSVKDDSGLTVAAGKWRDRVETLWLEIILIAIFYNNAWLNGERNNPGLVLILAILRTGYPNIMISQRPEGRPAVDRAWTTISSGNREQLLIALRASYNQPDYEIWSAELLSELGSFIRRATGGSTRLEAKSGSHDDFVFSELHAEYMRSQFRTATPIKVQDAPPPVKVERVGFSWDNDSVGYLEE